ncbi:hypothetical protein I6A84_19520 [Frankia sp. CNm7]|uniref:Uncharacterized protein n=1 Tax=Frankia nepalensis TaxID=1836974 RepID=A0A937R8D6_9ACTN|nr:hypothetical protein [Frankia nepalensis]MBL7496585.1 hypothetical protein [Frankia nepalensis]MBL7508804.1 hypothetical protein [Frankia nepalensis]MBL7520218.1 hypothetical protein [Frankia nepalensis]MBL7627558.1 hypothetical protein [Frankia nepalensis]
MPGLFGVNLDVTWQLSSDLKAIRAALTSLGSDFNGLDGQSGSSRVESALDRFVRDSSDSRGNLDKLLERAIGLLDGLIEGTAAVDTALVQALGPAPGPAPAAAP